jgi:hypothetical protein
MCWNIFSTKLVLAVSCHFRGVIYASHHRNVKSSQNYLQVYIIFNNVYVKMVIQSQIHELCGVKIHSILILYIVYWFLECGLVCVILNQLHPFISFVKSEVLSAVLLKIQIFWEWCCVARQVIPSVFKDCEAFFFRVKQSKKNSCLRQIVYVIQVQLPQVASGQQVW